MLGLELEAAVSRGKGRQRWHCAACGKTSFGSEARALETLDVVTAVYESEGKDVPKRAYPCPYGNGYHLTKQESRV